MAHITEEKFLEMANQLAKAKRIPVSRKHHLSGDYEITDPDGNLITLYGEQVKQQYLSKMDQYYKIGLARFYSKMHGLGQFIDRDYDSEEINPKEISDVVVRIGELLRKPNSTDMYLVTFPNETKIAYGIVSDQHTEIRDIDFYNTLKGYCDELGENYNMSFDHSGLRSRISVDFPDVGIELNHPSDRTKGDIVGLRIYAGNSQFGHSALTCQIGALRVVCTNGLVGMDKSNKLWQAHRIDARLMMNRFVETLSDGFTSASLFLDRLAEASEISEQYIEDKYSIIDFLKQKWDLKVSQAQEVFRIMRSNPKYVNTSFWVAQAISEYARDIPNLDEQERLETIAGQMAFVQLNA